jgi:hypothetical protein
MKEHKTVMIKSVWGFYWGYVILLLLPSCIMININSSGYSFLNENDKRYIVITTPQSAICDQKNQSAVYAINGLQLKNCLSGNDSAVVYLWAPRCSSPNCLLIPAFHDVCKMKGYQSYVVAEYFDIPVMKAQNNSDKPLLAINSEYYSTERVGKLRKLFLLDLLEKPYSYKEHGYGRYMVFHGDKLVRVVDNIFNEL